MVSPRNILGLKLQLSGELVNLLSSVEARLVHRHPHMNLTFDSGFLMRLR